MESRIIMNPDNDTEAENIQDELLKRKIVWWRNKDQRVLVIMATLTLLFCVAEFAFGIIANSLALLSDAFHMLSDMISLVIGFIAIQLSHRSASKQNSYGWVRAEVIGGLVNGVFLVAVCFFIILEAIQRFLEPPEDIQPMLVIIVGGAGLGMNIIGLIMFASHSSMGHAGHSHSHGHGHGHAHGDKKHKHGDKHKEKKNKHDHGHGHGHEHHHEHEHREEGDLSMALIVSDKGGKHLEDKKHKKEAKRTSANLHAVFLHVLGDALGSVGAVGSGLVIRFVDHPWKYYADPTFSLILSIIILRSAIPLVKQCANVLLQTAPESVEMDALQNALSKVQGVVNIHELHVWQLSDLKHIATLHAGVDETANFPTVAASIKTIFHDFGIHNTTIQPEFVTEGLGSKPVCKMPCEPECAPNLCCETNLPHKNEQYGTLP